jgi:hypothetical protein
MDELRRLLHLIETDDVDEGLNIELKSHFSHPNPHNFRVGNEQKWVVSRRNNQKIEFKSERSLQDYFRLACLKTIAAFMNSHGGKLFIGVGDKVDEKTGKRPIFGVNTGDDFNRDKYKLKLQDDLKNSFSETYISKYLTIDFVSIGKPCVCVIDVKPIINDHPVIIKADGKEILYRRIDNRTEPVKNTLEIVLFGRDFWARLDNMTEDVSGQGKTLPSGWVGPFTLKSVDLDAENKVVSLNVQELPQAIVCKFANKYFSLSSASKALIGQTIILSSTGRYTVQSGYFSDIQKW